MREQYNNLKEQIQRLSLIDSLYVIWAYCENIQPNNLPLPRDISAPDKFKSAIGREGKQIYEWELELLLREVVVHSKRDEKGGESLKDWNVMFNAINIIKSLNISITDKYVNSDNALNEMARLVYRQFPWQLSFSQRDLIRHYLIYSKTNIDNLVKDKIGLCVQDLYYIGLMLLGYFSSESSFGLPFTVSDELINRGITSEKIGIFLNFVSKSADETSKMISAEVELNDKFEYQNIALITYPLIKYNRGGSPVIACPLRFNLFQRVTLGVYYELVGTGSFDNDFGESFSDFTGEIIRRFCINGSLSYLPEEEYKVEKNNKKKTVDWIVVDHDAALFVECKTKRIARLSYLELNDKSAMLFEIGKLADFVVQVYKTINDYRNNKYPSFPFDDSRAIFPLIVTLEPWYFFHESFFHKLTEDVISKLKANELPIQFADEMPYSICSVNEFEEIIHVCKSIGIKEYMRNKFKDGKGLWPYGPFNRNHYNEEMNKLPFLFDDELSKLIEN